MIWRAREAKCLKERSVCPAWRSITRRDFLRSQPPFEQFGHATAVQAETFTYQKQNIVTSGFNKKRQKPRPQGVFGSPHKIILVFMHVRVSSSESSFSPGKQQSAVVVVVRQLLIPGRR